MRSAVRFILNGELHEVGDCAPTTTLLDYLRNDCGLTGTKEGCAEGDCGACTVLVAETGDEAPRYLAVNACIAFLPAMDGKVLISVEGLAADDALHPVQEAMVRSHGSQCGFCTPGFVMSLAAMYHDDRGPAPLERTNINLNLAGNLCRCTGYLPIVRAAEASVGNPDTALKAKLDRLVTAQLERVSADGGLAIESQKGRYFAPATLDELLSLVEQYPQATLVAGGTDVGLWVTKQLREFDTIISTASVAELLIIREQPDMLSIGAAVRYREALPVLIRHYPAMRSMLERLGGMQVRNAGTIGGNIANGSPIGDMPPALVALGAQLELVSSKGKRTLELEDFFIEYGKQDLRPGEVVSRILLPLQRPGSFACYKLSKRPEQDISALCAGIWVRLGQGRVLDARICYGGMAGTPARARHCEQALVGQDWNSQNIDRAMDELDRDFEPISDMRASAEYRRMAARNLLRRYYEDSMTAGRGT